VAVLRRVAWWISKATRAQANASAHAPTPTHKHTQKYVRLTAFPLRQWFGERVSMLRYTHISYFVF
jgi:hypothetical protein